MRMLLKGGWHSYLGYMREVEHAMILGLHSRSRVARVAVTIVFGGFVGLITWVSVQWRATLNAPVLLSVYFVLLVLATRNPPGWGPALNKMMLWMALAMPFLDRSLSPETWRDTTLLTIPALVALLMLAIDTMIRVTIVRVGPGHHPLLDRAQKTISTTFYASIVPAFVLLFLFLLLDAAHLH